MGVEEITATFVDSLGQKAAADIRPAMLHAFRKSGHQIIYDYLIHLGEGHRKESEGRDSHQAQQANPLAQRDPN